MFGLHKPKKQIYLFLYANVYHASSALCIIIIYTLRSYTYKIGRKHTCSNHPQRPQSFPHMECVHTESVCTYMNTYALQNRRWWLNAVGWGIAAANTYIIGTRVTNCVVFTHIKSERKKKRKLKLGVNSINRECVCWFCVWTGRTEVCLIYRVRERERVCGRVRFYLFACPHI